MSPFLILVFVYSVGGYTMTSDLGALYGQRRSPYSGFRYAAQRFEDGERNPLSRIADRATAHIYYTKRKPVNQDKLRNATEIFRSIPSNPDKKETGLDKIISSVSPNILDVLKELVIRMSSNSTTQNPTPPNGKIYNSDRKSQDNSDYNPTNDYNNDGDKSSSNVSLLNTNYRSALPSDKEDEFPEWLFEDVPENISTPISENQTNGPPKDKENNRSESFSNTEVENRFHGFTEEFEMAPQPVSENKNFPQFDWKQSVSPAPVYPDYGQISRPFDALGQVPPYRGYYQNAVPLQLDFLKGQLPVHSEQNLLPPSYQGNRIFPYVLKAKMPRKSEISMAREISKQRDLPAYSSLLYLETYNKSFSYQCGGIIISKDWALTSAACVDGFECSDLLVRPARSMDGGKFPKVETIIIHREYKFSDMGRPVNDIALLKVNPPFSLSFQNLHPAKLAVMWQNTPEGSFATTIVLRRPADTNLPPMMNTRRVSTQTVEIQKSNATVISLQECSAKLEIYADNRNICTQRVDTGDKMNGCSPLRGSPVLVNGIVVGVASLPEGCDTGLPDYHTQVSTFREWIAAVIGV